jgi:hypothetical protein
MRFTVYVTYKNEREIIDVDAPSYYDALMQGASEFIKKHPSNRLHDDRRRPYPIPLKPSWLVTSGFVRARRKEDRRIKY